jgi:hypothetical protein
MAVENGTNRPLRTGFGLGANASASWYRSLAEQFKAHQSTGGRDGDVAT